MTPQFEASLTDDSRHLLKTLESSLTIVICLKQRPLIPGKSVVEGKESFIKFPPEMNGPVFFPSAAALAPPVVNVIKPLFFFVADEKSK